MSKALQALKKARSKTGTRKGTSSKFNFTKFSKMFKDEKYLEAVKGLLASLDEEKRVKFVLNLINKSSFRGYMMALKKFNAAITLYCTSKDKKVLEEYLASMATPASFEPNFRLFTELRVLLINSLLKPEETKHNCFHALLVLETVENRNNLTVDQYMQKLGVDLAVNVWPDDAKGLKILYGSV